MKTVEEIYEGLLASGMTPRQAYDELGFLHLTYCPLEDQLRVAWRTQDTVGPIIEEEVRQGNRLSVRLPTLRPQIVLGPLPKIGCSNNSRPQIYWNGSFVEPCDTPENGSRLGSEAPGE